MSRVTSREELAGIVRDATNEPWFNCQAWSQFTGYWQAANAMGGAVDDISDVIEWLREEGDYAKADRLRAIAGRLARAIPHAHASQREGAQGWK